MVLKTRRYNTATTALYPACAHKCLEAQIL